MYTLTMTIVHHQHLKFMIPAQKISKILGLIDLMVRCSRWPLIQNLYFCLVTPILWFKNRWWFPYFILHHVTYNPFYMILFGFFVFLISFFMVLIFYTFLAQLEPKKFFNCNDLRKFRFCLSIFFKLKNSKIRLSTNFEHKQLYEVVINGKTIS